MSRRKALYRHYQLISENQLSFRQINKEPSSSPQELSSRALAASEHLLLRLGLKKYQSAQWGQGPKKPPLSDCDRYFANALRIDRAQVLLDDGSLRPPLTASMLASATVTDPLACAAGGAPPCAVAGWEVCDCQYHRSGLRICSISSRPVVSCITPRWAGHAGWSAWPCPHSWSVPSRLPRGSNVPLRADCDGQVYNDATLSGDPDLCKELAVGFAHDGFDGIREQAVITEYIGSAESFQRASQIRRDHPESARWFIKMEGMSRALNGCPVDVAKMAQQHGLASIANNADTQQEANARICVRPDLVSPITGLSPVILLIADKFIPASQPATDNSPAVYVKIRWAYPKKALQHDHVPMPPDSTDEEEEEEEEEGGGSKGGSTMVSNPLRVSKGGKGGGKGAVPQMPKGWEEFQTKEGAYYYFNRAKGITTWEKVRGPRPAARAARPHAPALTTLVPPTSRFLPHKQPKPVYL